MHAFKDATGRNWIIDVKWGTVKRVKAKFNVDFTNLAGDKGEMRPWAELVSNLETFVPVLFECAIKEDGQTLDSLGDAWDGDTYDAAIAALQDAIIDFFPSQRREPLKKLFQKIESVGDKVQKNVSEKIDGLDENEIAESVQRLLTLARAGNGSKPPSSGAPASSAESTQPASVSAN